MSRVAVLLAVLALALAGCTSTSSSSGNFEGAEKAVADAIGDVQAAAERKDSTRLCEELITTRLADEIRQGAAACGAEMEKVVGDVNDFDLKVTGVEVSGNEATATVENENAGETAEWTFGLVKDGQTWRLDSVKAA